MTEKILVPVLGESIMEATVSKWLKKKGELVSADESIVELETDKVNLEVPAPVSGILSEVNSKEGSTVEVGAILGVISTEGTKNIKIKKNEKVDSDKVEEIQEVKEKNNNLKLEIEKISDEEPIVLTEEQPLVLTEEVKDTKITTPNTILSPAVRKIVE